MRARHSPVLWGLMLAGGACAFGCQLLYEKNDLSVTTGAGGVGGVPTTGGTLATAGSAPVGGGGAGGVASSSGGSTSSAGAAGSAMTSGSGGDMDGGTDGGLGCSTQRLFMIATSPGGLLCGTLDPGDMWNVKNVMASSSARPAAAILDASKGVGIFYQEDPMVPGQGPLRAIELANGACGAPADVPGAITKAAPSAAVLGGGVKVLFQGALDAGVDHPFLTGWKPGSWTAPAMIATDIFSPAPAGLGASATESLAVYGGVDGLLYRVRYSNGAWQTPAKCFVDAQLKCETVNNAMTPAVVALDNGHWLVVYQDKVNITTLRWLTWDGVTSTASAAIAPVAVSDAPVSLVAIPGGAVLGFRKSGGGVYAAIYDAATDSWPKSVHLNGASMLTSPSVAAGVCDHVAEMAYVDQVDGSIKHTWLVNGSLSAPATIGGSMMKGVAISRAP